MRTVLRNLRYIAIHHLIKWNILRRQRALTYDGLEISFKEEFDGRRLNTNKWMTHYYWGHSHSDYEHQFYSSDAFNINNSVLTINVEDRKVKGWYIKDGKRTSKTFDVTSGLIHTGEYFKQRFGRFEIRCTVPKEKGYLPSFWLINPSSYPPEIDVMDYSEGNNDVLHVGHAYGDEQNKKLFYRTQKKVKGITANKWNTYTLDWTPTELIWYVNGYEVYRVTGVGIPQTPMYIAINLAIAEVEKENVSVNKMKIDWVRAYKFTS